MNVTPINGWIGLGIGILFGVLGTLSLKLSQGFQKVGPSVCLVVSYIISFAGLTFAMRQIELSVVYAVWSGVGTVLVSIIGMIYLKESVSFKKFIFLILIVFGVIGIHLSDNFY